MNKIVITKGWVKEWESDSTFTIEFNVESEEDRSALLDIMKDRVRLKITIEKIEDEHKERLFFKEESE